MTSSACLLNGSRHLSDHPRASVSCHCDVCPNCCRVVRVPLTHWDLQRLANATALDMEAFAEWLAPDAIDMSGEPESFVSLDVGRRLLVLRHEGGGCRQLDRRGRCSVYAARPSACAAYPYAMTDFEGPESPRRLYVLPDSPCGENQLTADAAAEAAVRCVETELVEYVTIVQLWNRQQKRRHLAGHRSRSAKQFFEFLRQQPVARLASSISAPQ